MEVMQTYLQRRAGAGLHAIYLLPNSAGCMTACLQGTCVLANGTIVPPVNLFKPFSNLYLRVDVNLAAFTSDIAANTCTFNASQVITHSGRHAAGCCMPMVGGCMHAPMMMSVNGNGCACPSLLSVKLLTTLPQSPLGLVSSNVVLCPCQS